MTSSPEQITVACPACGNRFETWWRPSMDPDLDGFDPSYVEEMTTATCPACGTTTKLDGLVVEDGIFHFPNE